jgi:hypothetical protein
LRQLKKPQTVPFRLRLPSENVWVKLIEHVTGVFGFVIGFVSRKLCVNPPRRTHALSGIYPADDTVIESAAQGPPARGCGRGALNILR